MTLSGAWLLIAPRIFFSTKKKHKGIQKTVIAIGSIVLLTIRTGAFAQEADGYPKPVSEYTEQTGPGTMTFLSYLKYYRNEENALTLVDTTLRASKQPDWDYEVTAGIWTFRARLDGTFQAEHAGDVFTYRFSRLGVGRGGSFAGFDGGEPRWSDYQVMGDTIRWTNVYPDVDLVVRYIHDILKVDVIVKEALLERIRSDVKAGRLNGEDYLTARFEIPNVLIQSEARQDGKPRDLFASSVDMAQPVEFVQGDRVMHRLRPVQAYITDTKGEPLMETENVIRTAQTWRLNENAPGEAEMSVLLSDLTGLPQGDLVIDPSSSFADYGAHNVATRDAELENGSSSDFGGQQYIYLNTDDHAVFTCDLSALGYNNAITSMKLKIYLSSNSMGLAEVQAHNIEEDWLEGYVDWYERESGVSWDTEGGTYSADNPGTTSTFLTYPQFVYIDLTRPFNARYSNYDEINDQGFLLKVEDYTYDGVLQFITKEYPNTDYRWKIEVTYYEGARAQSVWHRPFLKRRDGDPSDPDDRWFPIGWYTGIEHHVANPGVYAEGDIVNFADGFDADGSNSIDSFEQKTYIYNVIDVQPWMELRNKWELTDVWGCGVASPNMPEDFSEIDDYQEFLTTLNTVYNTTYADGLTRDFYMLPAVADTLMNINGTWLYDAATTTYDMSIFSGVSSAASYGIAEASCESFLFNWSVEDTTFGNLINGIKNYPPANPRLIGWDLDEEPYGLAGSDSGHRTHISDRVNEYANIIWSQDNNSPGKYPIYTIEICDVFYSQYTWDSTNGETIVKADDENFEYLKYFDYITEDFSMYADIYSQRGGDDWVDAVYMVECAMRYTKLGYLRWITARTQRFYNSMLGQYVWYDPAHVNQSGTGNKDKYRFLPYSSWAVGGQGLLIFSLDHPADVLAFRFVLLLTLFGLVRSMPFRIDQFPS